MLAVRIYTCILVYVFQTAANGHRLDSQLSAPHRFMTLGSWTCKAGPPSRHRHIFLKLPNRRSFCLLTVSIKKHNPLAEVGQAKQPLPQAGGWLLEFVEQGRFLHVKFMSLCWLAWLLACCLFICFVWPHAMAPAIASDQKKQATMLVCFFDFLFLCLFVCLFVWSLVCLCVLFFFPLFLF